jgi:hypothetical protein
LKARLLAAVHDIAACAARVEARAQRRDGRVRFRPLQRLLRERQPQQQRVDPRFALHQRDHLRRASMVEQPVAVRAQRVKVARVGGQCRLEVRRCARVAAALRDFAQQ